MDIQFKPIGIVHSPFKDKEDVKRERHRDEKGFSDIKGVVEIYPEFSQGLEDIDGFSHLVVIFAFHKSPPGHLKAHPPFDRKERGVFATRSPHRPNPIGMTVVRFHGRCGSSLHISGFDMIEGTPVLDIKPYTRRDLKPEARFGWLDENKEEKT
jgi:tRNA-Thr(GGU) m(6)t(6)A37 methyltransferase TsaA